MKLTLTLILAGSGFLLAQEPDREGPPPPPIPPVILVLDENEDGVLSAGEIENAPEALAELDEDGNGRLSERETRPQPPEGGRRPRRDEEERPLPPVMEALDQNGDGTISKRETARAAKSLLELDENEDGELTEEELRPEPPMNEKEQPGLEGGGPFGPGQRRGFRR
ncbi:MAG: hypothetical protein AAGC74_06115 [Verrucomicrobiota bacterium]